MSTRGLLTIIAVILLGIFAVVVVDASQESTAEQIADDFSATLQSIEN